MMTIATAMSPALFVARRRDAEHGSDAGAGPFDPAQNFVAGFFHRRGARQGRVEIERQPAAVVLHNGEFFLEVRERHFVLQPLRDGGLQRGEPPLEAREGGVQPGREDGGVGNRS